MANIIFFNAQIVDSTINSKGALLVQEDKILAVVQGDFSREEDANKFCETTKKYELLLVPSDDFGVKGFVRISYCVSPDQIKNSLEAFKKLIEEYK